MSMPPRHQHLNNGGLLASIRELVFGLEDSLVSTLGVVVGIGAGTDDPGVVILSGIVLVVVEALSMSAGSFLSSKSHREMLEQAVREERQEIETEPERETDELRAMYRSRGFDPAEVEILVRRITGDKKLWLEEMIAKELKIGALELEGPKQSALVMFFAYLAGGVIPVLPYAFFAVPRASIVASALTVTALFFVGVGKARATGTNMLRSGLEMVLVSASAAGVGYLIGKLVGAYFGIDVR